MNLPLAQHMIFPSKGPWFCKSHPKIPSKERHIGGKIPKCLFELHHPGSHSVPRKATLRHHQQCQGTLVCKGVHLERWIHLTSPWSNGCKDWHQTKPFIHDGSQRPIYIPHWLSGAMVPWNMEFRIQITVGIGYVQSFCLLTSSVAQVIHHSRWRQNHLPKTNSSRLKNSAWKTMYVVSFGDRLLLEPLLLVSERVRPCLVILGWPRILIHTHLKEHQEIKGSTLQGTNISHLGKRKIIFKSAFTSGYDMLLPRRVSRISGPTNHAWIVNHTCNSSVYRCITCTCFEIGYIF